jgi:hypothetical protein
MSKSTTMRYQVEAYGHVYESRCQTLREARVIRDALKKRGATDAVIARYDTSKNSDYYEVVE